MYLASYVMTINASSSVVHYLDVAIPAYYSVFYCIQLTVYTGLVYVYTRTESSTAFEKLSFTIQSVKHALAVY